MEIITPKVGEVYEVFAKRANWFSPYFFYRVLEVNIEEGTAVLGALGSRIKEVPEERGENFTVYNTWPTENLLYDTYKEDKYKPFEVKINPKTWIRYDHMFVGNFPNIGSGFKDEEYLDVKSMKPLDKGRHLFSARYY